jgi:glycosyltransferase involved in cell wall biosynthesis
MYSRLAASSRIRSCQYFPFLHAAGIDVTHLPLFGDEYVRDFFRGRRDWAAIVQACVRRVRRLFRCGDFDLVWIERELFPYLPAWGEALLSRAGVPFVVDYDDAVFHKYDTHRTAAVRVLLGRKIDTIMQMATLVIAGNAYIEEHARLAGAKRVERIPTAIDLDRYPPVPRLENPVFTVGWIGSPGTARYLQEVRDALAELCARGSCRVVLVGSGDVDLEGVPAAVRPWFEDTEAAEIRGFDVGIMPVPDNPWERGKSGYKLIQYMACGLPVVASPVGENRRIVEDGLTGFLAMTREDWVRSLARLREYPRLREEMGRRGRRKVEEAYCLQVTAPRLAGLLIDAVGP